MVRVVFGLYIRRYGVVLSIGSKLLGFHLKTGAEFSVRNFLFLIKTIMDIVKQNYLKYILPNSSSHTWPWVLPSPEQKLLPEAEKCFWEVERGWRVRMTTLPPFIIQLYRQCEILNI
jgi:hypothetical protein